ncbi:hypothetical protein [Rhodohalobacter sp.]|uniref:hypothetical protein n=1 Tax=Rhodohalobacter sp. TaxID=1974210 RepID=UPI002ACEB1BF|nr:hypothetical protein [Rhodohalobacter sp.]MDZ7755792.1 hypothetical protein [Rhodohalobacter sp.]
MKYLIVVLVTVVLMAALVLLGRDRSFNELERADVSAVESSQHEEIADSEVYAEFKAFRIETANKIMANNRSFGEIREKIKVETDMETKFRHVELLSELKMANSNLKRELDDYIVSDRENLDLFKDNFCNKMDDLEHSLNDFFSDRNTSVFSEININF